jgi:hypothetical protein
MEHGKVTSVTYRDGVVYCDVRGIRVNTEYDSIPVLRPHSGFIQVPERGAKVAMHSLDDGTRFIEEVIHKPDAHPDSMREGELTIQLDENTRVAFEKQRDGTFDLHLDASGDVYINGTKQ